jgi:hypothetical protein
VIYFVTIVIIYFLIYILIYFYNIGQQASLAFLFSSSPYCLTSLKMYLRQIVSSKEEVIFRAQQIRFNLLTIWDPLRNYTRCTMTRFRSFKMKSGPHVDGIVGSIKSLPHRSGYKPDATDDHSSIYAIGQAMTLIVSTI